MIKLLQSSHQVRNFLNGTFLPRKSSKLSLWYPICGKWTDINLSWSPRSGKELQCITWRITRKAQQFYLLPRARSLSYNSVGSIQFQVPPISSTDEGRIAKAFVKRIAGWTKYRAVVTVKYKRGVFWRSLCDKSVSGHESVLEHIFAGRIMAGFLSSPPIFFYYAPPSVVATMEMNSVFHARARARVLSRLDLRD